LPVSQETVTGTDALPQVWPALPVHAP